MQAALKDLSLSHHDSQPFLTCQRVLHNCHEIIFGDLPPQTASPYVTLNLPFRSRYARRKIRHNAEPVIVGIGVLLAGVPVMPQLTTIMGEVAIEQGRVDDESKEFRSVESQDDQLATGQRSDSSSQSEDAQDEQDDEKTSDDGSPSVVLVSQGQATWRPMKRRSTIGAAQTVPALPLHLQNIRRSRASEDPLGQLDSEQAPTPFQSSPSITSSRPPPPPNLANLSESLLGQYDAPSQSELLRGHYCRSEV